MKAPEDHIARMLGSELAASRRVAGGCIHDSRRLDLADGRRVFVKIAKGHGALLLAAESRGLALLQPHIRVPHVAGEGETDDGWRWLAMEWLDLMPMDDDAWRDLGRRLAALHAVKATGCGLDHDNFIGATRQINHRHESWSAFYLECRLRPQLAAARARGHDLPVSAILDAAARVLNGHDPAPALLHGDLWVGNVAAVQRSSAVVFDPAPYFGDPETDLAMLELFGGELGEAFLEGYGAISPDRIFRRPLYDLYHALNHLNLFGSDYLSMVRQCLAGIRCG